MRAERPLRVPLQLGTSALTSLVLTAAYFIPGSVLVGVPATVLWLLDVGDLGDAGGYIFLPGAIVLGISWKYLLRARTQRPSDLLLTADGFELRGGPHSGERVAWSELSKVTLEAGKKSQQKEDDDSDLKQLCVYRGSKRFELAAAADSGEQRSLVELARTLEAGRGALPDYQKRTAEKDDATALLVCPSCAAAVPPADEATVVCTFCQAVVPVGDEVRKRLRDARDVAQRPDRDVARLLDQPGAGRLSALLGLGAVFMLSAWPTALVLATYNYNKGHFTAASVGWLGLSVVACVFGVFGIIRAALVDRTALRLVALDFGAIPQGAGKPYLCRRCLAPMDPKSEQVLVSCVYCGSDNVLGIDLRRDARVARAEAKSLARAMLRRAKERRRWRGVSIADAVLVVVAVYSLKHGVL